MPWLSVAGDCLFANPPAGCSSSMPSPARSCASTSCRTRPRPRRAASDRRAASSRRSRTPAGSARSPPTGRGFRPHGPKDQRARRLGVVDGRLVVATEGGATEGGQMPEPGARGAARGAQRALYRPHVDVRDRRRRFDRPSPRLGGPRAGPIASGPRRWAIKAAALGFGMVSSRPATSRVRLPEPARRYAASHAREPAQPDHGARVVRECVAVRERRHDRERSPRPPAEPQLLRGHVGQAIAADASADGRYIASGAYDDTVRVWDGDANEADPAARAWQRRARGAVSRRRSLRVDRRGRDVADLADRGRSAARGGDRGGGTLLARHPSLPMIKKRLASKLTLHALSPAR